MHRSMYDLHPMFSAPFAVKMKAALLRPFLLLIKEPICLLFALYCAVIYGTLCTFTFLCTGSGSEADLPCLQTASSVPSRSSSNTPEAGRPAFPASPSSRSDSACSAYVHPRISPEVLCPDTSLPHAGNHRKRLRQQALRAQAHRERRQPARSRGAFAALLRRRRRPPGRPVRLCLDDPPARPLDRQHDLLGLLWLLDGRHLPLDAREFTPRSGRMANDLLIVSIRRPTSSTRTS